MVNIRKMVTFDPVWDSTLVWYERAVAKMKSRSTEDPTSWDYQAAIHGTLLTANHRSWNTCEHGGWYFFPWHRAYLLAFEAIVRSTVVSLSGPSDWSLPYWDYERAEKDALPPAFRRKKKSDGTKNHLYVKKRFADINDGASLRSLIGLLGQRAEIGLSSVRGLAASTFSGDGSNVEYPFGFGGGPTPSSFQENSAADIEAQMHGNVHVLIGLGGGLMARPRTAAADPIFWLHHANIDRLWSQWAADTRHQDPTDVAWRRQEWTFFTPTGDVKLAHPGDVENTVALGYRYDSVPEPVSPIDAVAGPPTVGAMPGDGAGRSGPRDLQPVGWSNPVTLTGHEVAAEVTVDQKSLTRVAPQGLDAPAQVRPYLELADIEAPESPDILYGVYLHAPSTRPSEDALVGVVSFFGAPSQPRGTDTHLHRLRYVFDITDALAVLTGAPGHPPDGISVTFRPLGPAQVAAARGLDAAEPDTAQVTIGRVALLYG
jgi:tyrosinase